MPLIRDFKTVFFPASYSTYLLPTHNPPQNTVGRINNRKLYTSSVLRPGCLCPTTSGSGWQPAPRNGIRGEREDESESELEWGLEIHFSNIFLPHLHSRRAYLLSFTFIASLRLPSILPLGSSRAPLH